TGKLNDAHARDSVVGTISSQDELLDLIPIVGRTNIDRCLDIGSPAHLNLYTVDRRGIVQAEVDPLDNELGPLGLRDIVQTGVERFKRDADAMKESADKPHMFVLVPVMFDNALQGTRLRLLSDSFHLLAYQPASYTKTAPSQSSSTAPRPAKSIH